MNEEQLKKELDIAKKCLAQAWSALRAYEKMMSDSTVVWAQTVHKKVGGWHVCNGTCPMDTHRARLIQEEKVK